jgi:CheY-like chemotaxis protein
MRLRILAQPIGTIDGLSVDQFRVGNIYELGTQLASELLAERWAERVGDDEPSAVVRPPPSAVTHIEPLLLVVDDDPEMRRMTELLLTAHDYHVIVAVHGQDAIQRLRDHCPDLIVLDLNMPVMDGWQFCRERRYLPDRCAAVPVLLVSGEDDAAAHANALDAVGVIKKPFDPDDLLDAVSAAIQRPGAPDGIGSPRPWRTQRSQP